MCDRNRITEYEIPQSGVDPEQVLQLCRPWMDSVCEQPPEEGWLNYTFHWLLAEYFPENFSVKNLPGAQQAVEYFAQTLTRLFLRESAELPFDPCRSFALLKKEEEQYCSILSEYKRFLECFEQKHVYTFMRL